MTMGQYGIPVTTVVPRCQLCGADDQALEHREGGHRFEPFPLPGVEGLGEYRQRERWLTAGQQRLLLEAKLLLSGRPTVRTRVWAWRQESSGEEPTPQEWEPLEAAAQALLARMACPHTDTAACASVVRHVPRDPSPGEPIPEASGFSADLRVWCTDCGEPFVWVGPMQLGVNPGQPTVDYEGTTLCAPLRPLSAPEDFGLQRPGFKVRAE